MRGTKWTGQCLMPPRGQLACVHRRFRFPRPPAFPVIRCLQVRMVVAVGRYPRSGAGMEAASPTVDAIPLDARSPFPSRARTIRRAAPSPATALTLPELRPGPFGPVRCEWVRSSRRDPWSPDWRANGMWRRTTGARFWRRLELTRWSPNDHALSGGAQRRRDSPRTRTVALSTSAPILHRSRSRSASTAHGRTASAFDGGASYGGRVPQTGRRGQAVSTISRSATAHHYSQPSRVSASTHSSSRARRTTRRCPLRRSVRRSVERSRVQRRRASDGRATWGAPAVPAPIAGRRAQTQG
jgi:hypothetical protein